MLRQVCLELMEGPNANGDFSAHGDMGGNRIGEPLSVAQTILNKVGVSRLLATFLSLIFFTNAGAVISLLFSHAIQ